jgi:hypothetical protein
MSRLLTSGCSTIEAFLGVRNEGVTYGSLKNRSKSIREIGGLLAGLKGPSRPSLRKTNGERASANTSVSTSDNCGRVSSQRKARSRAELVRKSEVARSGNSTIQIALRSSCDPRSPTPKNGHGCASQAEALLWHSYAYDNAVVKPI